MLAYIKALIAGFLSVLSFHQGMLWILDRLGYVSIRPWNFSPVAPFGIPAVIQLALWGALWAIVLWLLIRRAEAAGYFVGALLMGAVLPTVVYFLALPLAHGASVSQLVNGLHLHSIIVDLVVNASFGLGVAVFMRVLHPPR